MKAFLLTLFLIVSCNSQTVSLHNLSACNSEKVSVTIHNKGTETMYSVILHVTGGTYSLGNIPANASKSVQVAVTGESHIELSQAQGKRLILNVYLEPGYHSNISANVTTDSVLFVDQNYNINPL